MKSKKKLAAVFRGWGGGLQGGLSRSWQITLSRWRETTGWQWAKARLVMLGDLKVGGRPLSETRFHHFSKREQVLMGVMGGLLVFSMVFFPVKGILGYTRRMGLEVETKRAQLKQLDGLVRELTLLNSAPPVSNPQSLPAWLSGLVNRIGLGDRASVIPLGGVGGVGGATGQNLGMELRVDKASLDEAAYLIFSLESAFQRLSIIRVEIAPSYTARESLRLVIRLQPLG